MLDKCSLFTDWCKTVGIIAPKLKYPGFFEDGLIGLEVTQPIKHREAFIAVPYSAVLTTDVAKNDAKLKQFYDDNAIFQKE